MRGDERRGEPIDVGGAGGEGLRISRRLNNEWTLVHSIVDLTQGLLDLGEYEEALRNAREGVEVARELPIPNLYFFALTVLGNTRQALLDLEGARGAYAEAEVLIEATSSHGWRAFLAPHLCANRALAGDWEGAHAHAREAVAARKDTPAALIWIDFERHHETGALLRGGDEEMAREEVRRFGEQAGKNQRHRIPYLRSLATLTHSESEQSLERLLEAKALAEEIGLPGESWQIHAAIGELWDERGEPEEARRAFLASAEVVNALARRISDQDLRDAFLSTPQVRRALELR